MYKSGTGTSGPGHWDACVGTCDLVTQDEVWDAGTCGTGTREVKYGDAETSNAGTRRMLMIVAKIRVICDISFFVKMCYLLSTLDSIVQNHIGHLMMFTKKYFLL